LCESTKQRERAMIAESTKRIERHAKPRPLRSVNEAMSRNAKRP